MPFSKTETRTEEEWTRFFEKFLKPLIEEVPNVEAFRSSPLRENVQEQIIKDLVFSPIVVADLTDCKPNVFWELGVRQSFKHGTVTIADEKTKIPFHLEHKGILKYKKDPSTDEQFKLKLKKALEDCIEHGTKPDSPVLIAITGRGSLYSIIHKEENKLKLHALRDEVNDNRSLLDALYKQIDGRVQFVFKTYNINLLLAYRYLDEPSEFYIRMRGYCISLNICNTQIREAPLFPQKHKFLKRRQMNYDLTDEVLKLLDRARIKVENQL